MKLLSKTFLSYFIFVGILIFFYIIFLFNQDVKYEKFLKLRNTLQSNSMVGKFYHLSFKTIRYFANEFDLKRIYYKIKEEEPQSLNLKMSSSDYADIKSQIEVFKKKRFIKDELNYWRKSKLIENNNQFNIKYKFHGTSTTPLKQSFFSLRIKFKKEESYLNHQRELNLIRIYFDSDENIPTIVINNFANKIGLLSPKGETVILKINDVKLGLFYKQERHGKEWFEKQKITNYSILKNNDDWDQKIFGHNSDLDLNEKNIEISGNGIDTDVALGSLKILFDAIKSDDFAVISSLIDIDYFAKFLALNTIINDNHSMTGDNLKFIYDYTNGKFKVLFRYEHTVITPIYEQVGKFNEALFSDVPFASKQRAVLSHKLFKILLKESKFRELRDKHLKDIVSKKAEIIEGAYKVYEEAYKNIVFTNIKLRHQKYLKKLFFNQLNYNLDRTLNYLNYAKIYITEEKKNSFIELSLINDSFAPIRLKAIDFKENNSTKKFIRIEYENEEQYRLPSINLNKNKSPYIEKKILIFTDSLIEKIELQNLITKKKIDQEHIYRNKISFYKNTNKKKMLESLKFNSVIFKVKDKNLLIKKGKYTIAKNIIVPPGINTKIEKGTDFIMLKNTSFLFQGNLLAEGTKNENISIKALNNEEPFGTFAIVGKNSTVRTKLSNFIIEGGSEAKIEGMVFLGQLSIHNSDVSIKHSQVIKSSSDDGVNIRNSNIDISHTIFSQNKFDQLDLDFCNGKITNNKFINNFVDSENNKGGDGIDLSGSNVFISMNQIKNLGDKGISVGEKSKAIIQENIFIRNNIAIAIKDESRTYNLNNMYKNNNLKVSMYVKKFIFKEPTLYLDENEESKKIKKDEYKITHGKIIFIEKKFKSNFYKNFINEITSSRI